MKTKFKTRSGYDFFEVSSAYQKCVRRGLEEKALHFAYELYISGMAEYFWKRTVIIAMEDVGLADPDAITHVNSLRDAYLYLHDKSDPHERLAIFQAVIYLCRAEKSRLVDWTKMQVVNTHARKTDPKTPLDGPCPRLEVPDFALDVHTKRGKADGKTISDFFKEGSHLENHRVLPKEQERRKWAEEFHKMSKSLQEACRPPIGSGNPLMPDSELDIDENGDISDENGQIWMF